MVRKQMELAVKSRAEMFHCLGGCQALALCGTVAAFHVREDAARVAYGLVVTVGVLLSQDSPEGGTASVCVEIKLLAKVWLDEARERHQRAFQVRESRVMGRGPEVFNVRIALSLAGSKVL